MKTTNELTKRETNPYKLITNNHGCIVVNERLVYGYLLRKVAEYIWVADINKLEPSLTDDTTTIGGLLT